MQFREEDIEDIKADLELFSALEKIADGDSNLESEIVEAIRLNPEPVVVLTARVMSYTFLPQKSIIWDAFSYDKVMAGYKSVLGKLQ